LSREEEFGVFDMADRHQLRDGDGNLYGLLISELDGLRRLMELGTKYEQVARFWAEVRTDAHWHGHPLWPFDSEAESNRSKQGFRPTVEVFDQMIQSGLLTVT